MDIGARVEPRDIPLVMLKSHRVPTCMDFAPLTEGMACSLFLVLAALASPQKLLNLLRLATSSLAAAFSPQSC